MKPHKRILPNGVRFISVPMSDTQTVTCLVLVEAGSKYETKAQSGLSHFLEHMCFKGTEKRPTSLAISSELEAVGAQYNAFTNVEHTGYYAKAHRDHLDTIVDVVSDIYQNQKFDEREMQKEKGVIIEEINMYEDLPHRKVETVMMEAMYGDQPAGWDIAGTRESVSAMTREQFIEYVKDHYVGGATAVMVAGSFDQATLDALIDEKFGSINAGHKKDKLPVVEKQSEPIVALNKKASDQSHMLLGFRTFDAYDERNFPLRVLSTVLGGGMSSRLFNKLRDEMGVCYYVNAGVEAYSDHGIFSIAAGVDTKRIEEVAGVLCAELKKLVETSVGDAELKKAKEFMIGSLYLDLETSDSITWHYGFQEILKKPLLTADEIAAKIRAVTPEDILRVAKEFVRTDNVTLAMVSPYEDRDALSRILKAGF